MAFTFTRPLLAVTLAIAACGDDKGTTDATTTTTPDGTTVAASTTGNPTTGGTDTTHDPSAAQTTGGVPCDQPMPAEDCICAPGCGVYECVDGFWSCECESCGSTELTSGDPSTSDTGGPGTTGQDTTGEPGTTGAPLCEPDPFPPFHNPACQTNDECAAVSHMVDCCGSIEFWGIGADAVDKFNAAEAMCAPKPVCDCAPDPTRADDGNVAEKVDFFEVGCLDGLCQTFLP